MKHGVFGILGKFLWSTKQYIREGILFSK